MQQYRSLLDKEIATLTVYGCSAENWKNVQVVEDFKPEFVSNTHFSGKILLGKFEKVFELPGGVKKHSGIFNAELHNCSVGNDVYINRINNYIANYEIEEAAFIENTDLLAVDGKTAFGNGTQVAVMIESGGREVSIFAGLTAPLAYMMAFYRHDAQLTERLNDLVAGYTEKQQSEKGRIGKNVRIVNCGSLKNVRIGDFSELEGVTLLENGTVVSNAEAPVKLGFGVQCNDFIIQSGTSVTDGALITRCFVGQGCLIGKQFSAIDSVFFANCQGLHGEAVSVFAGPYTVSHHKSTLMLTAIYSFMNAGSGSNFSNHMYKLGPVHQGVTERGVKTSSNSYVMWPARIGAFSVVLGTHKGNPDLSDLPFSYLIENESESHLLPGINLHSAGTIRDVQKWPKRDLRKGEKTDPVCFDFLSPYTIGKAQKGIEILKELLQNMDSSANFVWYQNCKIKRSAIRKGIELYEMAVDNFTAQVISKNTQLPTEGKGQWVDLAGLLAPQTAVESLIEKIVNEQVGLPEIIAEFQKIYAAYEDFAAGFAAEIIENSYGKSANELTKTEKQQLLEKGRKAEAYLNDMILRDAKKEFSTTSKIGFGIDGDETVRNADFEATRGTYENHPFVIQIQEKL